MASVYRYFVHCHVMMVCTQAWLSDGSSHYSHRHGDGHGAVVQGLFVFFLPRKGGGGGHPFGQSYCPYWIAPLVHKHGGSLQWCLVFTITCTLKCTR